MGLRWVPDKSPIGCISSVERYEFQNFNCIVERRYIGGETSHNSQFIDCGHSEQLTYGVTQ